MQYAIALDLFLFAGAAIFIVSLPVLPTGPLLLVVCTLRSLTDVGSASGGSLLPSSTISAALGAATVLAALVPKTSRLPGRLRLNILVLSCLLFTGTVVAISSYGVDADLLKEPLRLASIVAIFVLTYRHYSDSRLSEAKMTSTVTFVPGFLLIMTFLLHVPFAISDQTRATGTFSHPNSAAAFFSITGTFCFAYWFFNRNRLLLLGALVSAVASIMTGSLGGIISLCVGIIAIAAVSSKLKAPQKGFFFFVLILAGIFAYSQFGNSGRLAEFESFDAAAALQSGTSSDSLEWRVVNWGLLVEIWQSKPLLGHGLGTTYTYIMPLGGPPHSLFVQVLVELGIFGYLLLTSLLILNARVLREKLRNGRWEASAMFGLFAVLIVNGSESNLLGYTPAMYVLALFSGILCARLSKDPTEVGPLVLERPSAKSKTRPWSTT